MGWESENGSIDFESVFIMLNNELGKASLTLEIVRAGGFVLQINGYRATVDVDAFFKSSATIEKIIRKVGDEVGINKAGELWLNNSISNMNPEPPKKYCKILYELSNLIVETVDMLYLVGMKLKSGREQDLRDVSEIIKKENFIEPLKLFSTLKTLDFKVDISIVLDAFERAYGMPWLENYYLENEEELRKHF